MSRDRGSRLQNALASYLRNWWEHAESAGAGRNGRDVLGTPGVWWENKTAEDGEHRPGQFMRQAVKGAAGPEGACSVADCGPGCGRHDLPVVVWWPPGAGKERPELAIAMLPLPELMDLLVLAEYAPARKDVIL